jgi:signal transduction histidine kinase
LNNVVKHAQATEVRISLTPGKTGFVLVVEDNGRGFPAQLSAGNGLANMRRRLQEISGTCECQPAAESGTKIIFTVTLKGNI